MIFMSNHENKDGNLNYLDHLEILRVKIVSIIVVAVALTVISFFMVDKIIIFLKMPISDIKINLYFFKPQEKFLTYLKIAFFTSLFISFPFAVLQIAGFISPALKTDEKKYFNLVVFFIMILFYAGCAFSYWFLTPAVFDFFVNFSKGDQVLPVWSVGEYFDLLLTMIILIGISFEFPLILLFLIKVGIIDVKTLSRYRRHSIVAIFIIAAVITPTVDILTQSIVGIILFLLFEITLFVGRFVEKGNYKRTFKEDSWTEGNS
jgi:sec-independent protein translocase protein TatC